MHRAIRIISILPALLSLGLSSAAQEAPQAAVDEAFDSLRAAVQQAGMTEVAAIDHSRLAAAEGEVMPPARVLIFSTPDAGVLQRNIRAGLDLPFRVLSYAEQGEPKVSYTDAEFLTIRHGLDLQDVGTAFDATLKQVLDAASIVGTPAPTEGLELDFGIIELESTHDQGTTIARLQETVMAQGDTVWFGEVDFTAQAAGMGIELPPAVLLLFGGPAPGGIAMAEFPAIGLDAFCQKLLVYTDDDGTVKVLFNDIAALAELHYGRSAKPHHALNKRLTETFKAALN